MSGPITPPKYFKPPPPTITPSETQDQLHTMVLGKPYIAVDPYLMRIRDSMAATVYDINQIRDLGERMKEWKKYIYFPHGLESSTFIAQGFVLEYGFNISLGEQMWIGPNCGFYDVCQIKVGDRTMFGPNCQLFTPSHPISPEARNGLKGPEWGLPITIGTDCWFGGNVTVCPGVTIGDGCTIGAGSVVTKDIPSRSVAVGNPARVIKRIKEDGTTENI